MILGYKTKNDRKIEELELLVASLRDDLDSNKTDMYINCNRNSDGIEKLEESTKERFTEYIDERTHLYTGLHERLEKIESIGDFEVLMKRVARVEEQFGPILGKVTDTFQSAMNTLISEAAKTNKYMADQVKESMEDLRKTPQYSKKDPDQNDMTIFLNGERQPIVKESLSYEDICSLSGIESGLSPIITYSRAAFDAEGKLFPNGNIIVIDGTIINVLQTDNT